MEVTYTVVSPLFRDEYLPAYKTSGAAGMDLHACLSNPVQIQPLERVRVPTGIAIQLPEQGVVALVYARSGLAWRHGIGLPNGVGVIDSDYTGEIQVLLTNFSSEPFEIRPGDRVAQLVVAPIYIAGLVQAEQLTPTERGAGGFGSTGVRQE
ncbi:deoxyuridine 5'-triphosphate nucleotidohydrolase [Alicyclobacillus ferrooxydans]|uniref:Deoxyuridine 5'-triphosphate nucleotidohydrolase n=2 Tax=Alicyclobacillus ferrooxydans TaxID=471514 RepID=A0A0P9CLI4_9BACL|nr:dUTP diphosphatase [Alicyclobacillus ferrooxydans]KPV39878.1 deoxyuridine 5'-triphosphate nucleotidohydrolase [Alicyclobacillus ferrooxydans]